MYGNGEIVQVLVVYDTQLTNLSVVETLWSTNVLDLRAASTPGSRSLSEYEKLQAELSDWKQI
ncbi:hypothetical protein KY284_013263 [Solanum tuberosum]|nr:hypothetical protein KY284_013263 [Solanum tuberosum]